MSVSVNRELLRRPANTYWRRAQIAVMQETAVFEGGRRYRFGSEDPQGACNPKLKGFRPDPKMFVVGVGVQMENIAEELKAVNDEVKESKEILQDLANKVQALDASVEQALLEQIRRLRTARMSAVSEVSQSLKVLADVRKFFLDSDYEREVERLERFVRVCRELADLKNAGVLDAVCDSALRLALKEPA